MTLSAYRLFELLDYATNYGEVDETTAKNDIQRDTIRAFKELLIVNGYDPSDRYTEE